MNLLEWTVRGALWVWEVAIDLVFGLLGIVLTNLTTMSQEQWVELEGMIWTVFQPYIGYALGIANTVMYADVLVVVLAGWPVVISVALASRSLWWVVHKFWGSSA